MMVITGMVFYFMVCVAWIYYCVKDKAIALTLPQIAATLGFKVLMGCLYGYIFLVKYNGDDTWIMHEDSLEQRDLLLSDPLLFITQMNPFAAFARFDTLEQNIYYYLSDLESWLLAKPFAVINIISGGNYYINIIFFCSITFWGQYWLFRIMIQRLNVAFRPLFIVVFFVPPVVFWLSGLRADGMLFLFTVLLLSKYDLLLVKFSLSDLLWFLLAAVGIVILRSPVFMLLIPVLVSWWLVVKQNRKTFLVFASVYASVMVIVLVTTIFSANRNLLTPVARRQQEFFALDGNTRFQLDTLKPRAASFVRVFPQAVENSFLRPFPWEAKGSLQYAAVLEVLLFLCLCGLVVWRRKADWYKPLGDPLVMSLIFFSISLYILVGYTVPFPGAIVRYKIIGELFLLVILTSLISWPSGKPVLTKV